MSDPTTPGSIKDMRERVDRAWQHKIPYNRQLLEIYRYFLPYRDVTGLNVPGPTGNQTPGDNRTDYIFDNTAPAGAMRFAGKLQSDAFPPFQDFVDIIAGPLMPEGDEKKALTEKLQNIARVLNGVRSKGSFAVKAHEMALDLFAGTGAMLMLKGDMRDPIKYRTVPLPEIALEEGPFGDVWGIDWRRKYKHHELKVLWPKGEFSADLQKAMADKPNGDVTIHQYTYYNPSNDRWYLVVFEDKAEAFIHQEDSRTSPWLTPRFFVVPGEVYGRGPGHLALPAAKTLNKVRELALLAAAYSVLGLWMRRDDGVFNPDTATQSPGAMWVVGSTGGALGPSLARLDVPNNFDVTSFVINDEREQLKLAMFDSGLPPQTGAVKSATEIAEIIKRTSQDFGGVFGRLVHEIVVPLVTREIDILEQLGLLPATGISIDQIIHQVRVVAPIASAQQADKAQRYASWLQMSNMLVGQQLTMANANVEHIPAKLGRMLGVDEEDIRTDADKSALMKMVGQLMAAQQAASQPAAQGPQGAQGAPQQSQAPAPANAANGSFMGAA